MGQIKILTSDVYNKISAGEVVERPASVVKELVENSIDAGASSIEISIKGGGIESIQIVDNGSGIDEDDVAVAFLKHATSKLSKASDLETIQSLGFRGEALASISSVSKMQLTTKTPFSETAVSVLVEEGEIVEKTYTSANVGTKIVVKDLFYNTPARKKFLKTPAREGGEITQYVTKLILTCPFLEIKYVIDGKVVFNFKGTGLEEAIYVVYGKDCLKNCIPINSKYQDVVVEGYVGSPEYTKPNSTYQVLSVNGRVVKDITIQTAVRQAFAPYLMTRSYPFFVLHLTVPFDEVDVNVHPTKQEVRFVDVRKVFVGVNLPIKQALSAYTENRSQQILTPSMDFNVLDTPPTTAKQSSLPDLYEEFLQPRQQDDVALKMEMDSIVAKNKQRNFEEYCDNLTSFYDKAIKGKPAPEPLTDSLATSQSATPIQFHKDYRLMQQIAAEQETFLPTRKQDDEFDFSNVKILGVLFDTYMLIEIGDKAVYIDQHAAHERLLFDKFMENASKLFMQPLMFPYVFTVKDDEAAFIEDNLGEIAKAGILIQPFGQNSFRVVEVASLFTDIKMDKFVNYILGYMDQYKVDSKKLTIDKIAQKACKAAVKAGDKLDSRQLESLVKQIYKNNALQCPHGRPICVEINKAHLEKMFKRIV